jgi:heme exporter protein D
MTEFLAMGGYAWYVWMSYGAVALVVLIESFALRARLRRAAAHARATGVTPAAPTPRFHPPAGDSAQGT